jgi:signal transduction histidine kinase/DNA-binding response OmpR family regulator
MKDYIKNLLVLFLVLFLLTITSSILFNTQIPIAANHYFIGSQVGKIIYSNFFLMQFILTCMAVVIAGIVVKRVNFLNVTVKRQSRHISKYRRALQYKKKQLLGQTDKTQKVLKTDKLIKHISHEFKTPLTVLLGYLDDIEEALESYCKESQGRDTSETVCSQIKYIDRLVHQLMDLSKVEGAIEGERKVLNVSKEINNVIPMYDGYAKKLEVEVRSSIKDDLVICADKGSFERIISNLICNAIKYNRKHGTVEVLATEDNGQVKIVVRDSGIGISGEDKEIIFKQFGVVENRECLDHKIVSTGLGLAIVKESVEANNGTIEVESKLGLGSVFTLRFPLLDRYTPGHDRLLKVLPENKIVFDKELTKSLEGRLKPLCNDNKILNTTNRTILLVEDIDDIAHLFMDELSSDFNVIRAKNGQEGLNFAQEFQVDVIVSDLIMPIMDGFEFAKAIKGLETIKHIPLLFLSAVNNEATQLKGLELGAVDFIQKPFNLSIIRLKIKNCLEHACQTRKTEIIPRDVRIKNSRSPGFTKKLDNYIEKHLSETFTVEEMASNLAMNRSAFTRKVKNITSLNTQQYILRYRLFKAYELLLSSPSVAEVAYSIGFSTQNHMSTAFTKQFGITCRERMSGKEAKRQPFNDIIRN